MDSLEGKVCMAYSDKKSCKVGDRDILHGEDKYQGYHCPALKEKYPYSVSKAILYTFLIQFLIILTPI
jgi:hypothetical protein